MISSKTIIRAGAVAAAVLAIGGVVAASAPVLRSDAPPWASKQSVQDTQKHLVSKIDEAANRLESIIVRGNILGAWRACQEASRAGNRQLALDNAAQIATLQDDYMMLTGLHYVLPPCP